jgi:UDP-N-acetylmuramoyl-tripeptide--D-alanyl-D-alanine ligase
VDALTLKDLAAMCAATIVGDAASRRKDHKLIVERVVIDSREAGPGDLFVALAGDRFDGHAFAKDVLAAGAVAVISEQDLPGLRPVLRVDDTVVALGLLGAAMRRRAATEGRLPLVVGVTGTNGKTGTKDLIVAALSSSLQTVGSQSSYNNAIGVPLTLLNINNHTEAVVAELGTNSPGEIAHLTSLVEPEIGVVTNIHPGHLEGLCNLAGVRAEKGALLTGLTGRSLSVLNRDDGSFGSLSALAPGEVISFGTCAEADFRATEIMPTLHNTRFRLNGEHDVVLRHLGRHAVLNALAALACSEMAGLPLADTIAALAQVPPPPGRLQFRRSGQLTILDDSYNANPGSVAAAAALISELGHEGRRVFVIGDMLELGVVSPELHEAAGRSLAQAFPQLIVAVGRYAEHVVRGAVEVGLPRSSCHVCATKADAEAVLAGLLDPGDLVLVKASRGMGLDALVTRLSSCTDGATCDAGADSDDAVAMA